MQVIEQMHCSAVNNATNNSQHPLRTMISDPSLEWAELPTALYIVKPQISVVKKLVHPPVCHGGFSCLVAGSHLLPSPTERARFQRDPSALPARDPPEPTSPLVSVSTLQQEEWNATALMYYELGINLLFFFQGIFIIFMDVSLCKQDVRNEELLASPPLP